MWLGALALMLMPFSTSPEDGAVVTFGLPLVVLTVVFGLDYALSSLAGSDARLTRLLVAAGFVAVLPIPFALLSPMPAPSLFRASVFLTGYVFALWIVAIGRRRNALELIGRAFTALGLILATYYVAHFALQVTRLGIEAVALERFVGGAASLPWGASNVVAGVIFLPLMAYMVMRRQAPAWWERLWPYVALLGIAATFSRTVAVLALAAILILAPHSGYKRSVTIFGGSLLLVLVAAYWMFALDPEAMETLFLARTETANVETAGGRLDIWAERLRHIPRALFAPHGHFSSIFRFSGVSPHNLLLTIAIEQGLLGLIAWGVLLFLLFSHFAVPRRGARREIVAASRGLRWTWSLVLAHLMVEDLTFGQPYIISFWTLFALSILYWRSVTVTAARPAGERPRSQHESAQAA